MGISALSIETDDEVVRERCDLFKEGEKHRVLFWVPMNLRTVRQDQRLDPETRNILVYLEDAVMPPGGEREAKKYERFYSMAYNLLYHNDWWT